VNTYHDVALLLTLTLLVKSVLKFGVDIPWKRLMEVLSAGMQSFLLYNRV